MELQLKHLDVYPKGLNGLELWDKEDLQIVNICSIHYTENTVKTNGFWSKPKDYKLLQPYLHPLSDLTKEITVNRQTFIPIERIQIYDPKNVDYLIEQVKLGFVEVIVFNILLEWHFDVFSLIDNDLAINISQK